MPLLTFLFGLLMIVAGALFFIITGQEHYTSLIPAAFGVLLIGCAGAALRAKWRMHAMHAAVLLAILVVLVSIIPLTHPSTWPKIIEPLLTIVLGVVYIVMCVQSFFAARRARKAEASAQKQPKKD